MNLVIFDFDETLTTRDTLRPFAFFLAEKQRNYFNLFVLHILLALYKLKIINDRQLKETFLSLFIKGMSEADVENIVKLFLQDRLKGLINQMVFEKLRKHVKCGDKVYIASANFDFLLKPLIEEWNLSGIISTETEKEGNYFTSKIIGNTCKGRNKLKRIKAVLGAKKLQSAIAYGDDEDTHLLDYVGHGLKI